MNFYSQKKLIKKLKEKGKNPLLFLPCLIIRLIVTAFTAVFCTVDMALSDKKGNFLGIERKSADKSRRYEKEMAELAARAGRSEGTSYKAERKLPKRPFIMRALSFTLAFAFAFMIIPEADVFALNNVSSSAYSPIPVERISSATYSSSVPLNSQSTIDLCDNYASSASNPNGYDVKIQSGTFNNLPYLTTVFLHYTPSLTITDNFVNISPDSAIFVKSSDDTAVANVRSQLGTAAAYIKVIKDPYGTIRSEIPDPPAYSLSGSNMNVSATSGVRCVTVKWDYQSTADGYGVYRIEEYSDGNIRSITKIGDYSNADYNFPNLGTRCYVDVTGTTDRCYYSVRPYRNTNDGSGVFRLYSSKHYVSDTTASARQIGAPPALSYQIRDLTVTLTVSNLDTNADYVKIFYKDQRDGMQYFEYIDTLDITSSTMTFTDPNPLSIYARDYTVVMYYDVDNAHRSNNDRPLSNVTEPNYATVETPTVSVVIDPKIEDPTDFKAVFDDNELHFTWRAPDSNFIPTSASPSGRYDIRYRLFINDTLKYDNIPNAFYNITNLVNSDILNGQSISADVQAYAIDTYSSNAEVATSNRVHINIGINTPVIRELTAGDRSFTVTWDPFNASTHYYTIYWRPKGTTSFNSLTTNTSPYTVTGLSNNTEYEVRIAADNSPTASPIMTVTPNNAPPRPLKAYIVECKNNSLTLQWDPAEQGLQYIVVVKNGAGNIIQTSPLLNDNIIPVTGLINDKEYHFEVYSVRSGTRSLTPAEVYGMSSPVVDEIANLSVIPQAPSSLLITWKPVTSANKYYLNRTDPNGNIERFDMDLNTSYVDSAVKNDVDYTYTVTTELIVGGKAYHKVSVPKTGRISLYIGTVEDLAAQGGDGTVTLTWAPTLNADGYYVEYCSITGNTWTQIGKVSTASFIHTGLVNGTELKYRVKAYRVVNNEEIFSPYVPMTVTARAGNNLAAPADFTATPADGTVTLKWSKVNGAVGYNIYVLDANGTPKLIDKSSKTTVVHNALPNGTSITYLVRAYRLTATGDEELGDFSIQKTVTVGTYLNAPTDLTATAGDGQVTLKWKKADGAEGYVVYIYDGPLNSFTPVGIVTATNFTHSNLVNGKACTYMVASYKTVSGEIKYSDYSISVTAIPMGASSNTGGNSTGGNNSGNNNKPGNNNTNNNSNTNNSNTNGLIVPSDNYSLYITGTTPYGMSNSNLITASSEKGAINQDTDVRFTLDGTTVATIQNVLDYYGEGLESFRIYPMDISLYARGTDTKVGINPGYYLTMTIPVPDQLLPYSEYISVVHISDNNQLEILPSVHVNVGGVDCIQFSATSFSPYAFVVYINDTAENLASGESAAEASSMAVEVSTSPAFMCVSLPELYRRRIRNKVFRIKK